jgi:hypothetical protein
LARDYEEFEMNEEPMTLKQMMLSVLQHSGEQMTYRDLTTTIWNTFPAHREHIMKLYGHDEKKARQEYRIRLGIQVKNSTGYFSATKSDGIVLVGLAATPADVLEEEDEAAEEEIAEVTGSKPSVYWYTFPAYKKDVGAFPIKIGRGNNPELRITQQVTAMPEEPVILGTREHTDTSNLERALHAVLALRNKRKTDAPGTEWFMTTPKEISELIEFILTAARSPTA